MSTRTNLATDLAAALTANCSDSSMISAYADVDDLTAAELDGRFDLTDVADRLLAACWRPPARVSTTREQLDALHPDAVITWTGEGGDTHAATAAIRDSLRPDSMRPVTVVHEPSETP